MMLSEIARKCFHVGDSVGQGQAMKLLNYFRAPLRIGELPEDIVVTTQVPRS